MTDENVSSAAKPREVEDFQANTPLIALFNNGRMMLVPKPLAFAQAEAVICVRVAGASVIATGSRKVPCGSCGEMCWRAASSLQRLPVLCSVCAAAVMPLPAIFNR